MEDNNDSEESTKTEIKPEFKKPVLFGRIGKLPKRTKTDSEKAAEQNSSEKSENDDKNADTPSSAQSKSSLPPAVLLKELSTPIPYKEPKWSGLCPDGSDYGLEVLKSGMIVEKVDLTAKPYFVFGRLANCDVVMAHPTISRHHAVLQYKAFAEDGEPSSGWYLYDLGSTHGTFLNKDKLKPSHYSRVRVGHQIKFGTSTRTYIVLGPDFDCEGESDLTVTEIKKRAQVMKVERDRMIQEAVEQREKDRVEEEKRKEQQGIDWGMGEDAEEEPDLSENPYASTGNEELYLEDPKKTLRGYCEREGHELSYDCEERGPGQFLCRVELPMDDARGRPLMAEVLHRGKKKEAVIACAMEACRILDRAGLLRQAKHESRRRKQRDWSADDYYDSDDDTFLDRTGSVEKKRNIRMRTHGGKEEPQTLTYDDLVKQIAETESQIALEEKNLERLRSAGKPAQKEEEDEDALDQFMTSLGSQGQSMAQKAEISRTKMTIQKLKGELSKTQRLAELARPAHLPPLLKKDDAKMPLKVGSNSVVYGKRIRLKQDSEKQKKVRKETKQDASEFVEEMDSDEDIDSSDRDTINSGKGTKSSDKDTNSSDKDTNSSDRGIQNCDKNTNSTDNSTKNSNKGTDNSASDTMETDNDIGTKNSTKDTKNCDKNTKATTNSERVFGPMRPPENYVIPDSYFDQETDRDLPEIEEKET